MMNWQKIEHELAIWRDIGQVPRFWWRDDDAVGMTPALEKLFSVSIAQGAPLMLAVVPVHADLVMPKNPLLRVAVHGFDHKNRAKPGEKKSEFPPHRDAESVLATLKQSREISRGWESQGWRGGDVFVPPWNRFDRCWWPVLSLAGFRGLSQFSPRDAEKSDGLLRCNTHLDVIDWSQRAFAGEDFLLLALLKNLQSRRLGDLDINEPIGLLTHHLVHDGATWGFIARLRDFLAGYWVDFSV